jgi:hypothetical protein
MSDMPFAKSMSVIKQANGLYRWNSISSNNIKDRDGETLSLKALQADVARTKMFGDDSHLRFYHIPYDIGGAPDYRAIIDGMLVESGEYYDEPISKQIAKYQMDHPEGLDGSGWGTSIGFLGMPDSTGTYYNSVIEERSSLPLSIAANEITAFGVKNKMTLSAAQQKALDMVLEDPAMVGIVLTAASAKEKSKVADAEGVVRKAKKDSTTEAANMPVFKKAGNYTATPQDAYGFGEQQTQQKDAAAVEAAIQTEGQLVAAARAADDAAGAAMNHTDAVIASAIAEGALAATAVESTEEAAEPAGDGLATEAPAAKAAATTAAPETSPAPANTETPQPSATKLSDEDMQGIAKWVTETVNKAVGDAMTAYDQKMQTSMAKMAKELPLITQAKMLNEQPRSTYERLKSFGAAGAAGFVEGDPEFVEKGKNLPAAPDDGGVNELMTKLGFAGL